MRGALADERGFTLVELLVSLALLSIAAVLILNSFQLDRSALARMQARAFDGEQVSSAQNLIRTRIEHLFGKAKFDQFGPAVDMDGEASSVEFIATEPNLSQPLQRYALSVDEAGELLLQQKQEHDAASAPSSASVLLKGVQSLDIGYYGPIAPTGAPGWATQWARHSDPPELMRIRVRFAQGDRRVWPELIVRPGVTVDSSCVLDPDTGYCRGR